VPDAAMPDAAMPMDYHTHTHFSWDSSMTPEELVARAAELGIRELAVTDHIEVEPGYHGADQYDWRAAWREVSAAREKYRGRLNVAFGVEVSFQSRYAGKIADLLRQAPFDFVLGSVHSVDGIDYSTRAVEELEGLARDPLVALEPYFRELTAAAESGLFDVIGHLEVFLRGGIDAWGRDLAARVWPRVRKCLGAIVRSGAGIEVNASGLRQGLRQTLPRSRVVRAYYALGGRVVTVGSDGHRPATVGYGIPRAVALLRRVGFEHLTAFRERRPVAVPL